MLKFSQRVQRWRVYSRTERSDGVSNSAYGPAKRWIIWNCFVCLCRRMSVEFLNIASNCVTRARVSCVCVTQFILHYVTVHTGFADKNI